MSLSTEEKNKDSLDCVNKTFKECLDDFVVFAEMIHESIYFINLDGSILYANSAARSLYGYSLDEFEIMSIFDLRREVNKESIQQQMKIASMEGILLETKHYKKDNSVIDVLVSSKGTTFGQEKVLISIVRDITERKRTQFLIYVYCLMPDHIHSIIHIVGAGFMPALKSIVMPARDLIPHGNGATTRVAPTLIWIIPCK